MIRAQTVRAWAFAFLVVALFAAMTLALICRGPWYDEFYTHYVTRPGPSFFALWPVWMRDNHPPLFYFLAWATNFLGDPFVLRRILNLGIALVGGGALFVLCRVRPALRPLAVPYVIALAGYLPMIGRVSELRSNFLAYVAAAIAVAALSELARPGQSPRSRGALAFLGVALAVSFSVHLAATMIVGAVSAAFGLRMLMTRDWRGAKELAAVGAIASAPFLVTMALQYGTIARNTQNFWIQSSAGEARWTIRLEIIANLTANWPLTAVASCGLAMLGWQTLKERRLSDFAWLTATLGVGVVLAVIVLIIAHLQRPFVIDRYLVSLHPPIAMILAIGVATVTKRVSASIATLIDGVMIIGALFAIYASLQQTLKSPSWNGTAVKIAQITGRCPGVIVHVDEYWNKNTQLLPPVENRAVFPYAYRWVARAHGFELAPVSSRAIAEKCPTVIWAEHAFNQRPDAEHIGARLRQQGFTKTDGRLERIGDGWIYVIPPPSP
ncbi:MAG: hypothetical protein EOO76_01665 [Novosphingobium sp.]|nr:MAG: hypothetical protein EOO76_01665 [Novosphingobium sp.]